MSLYLRNPIDAKRRCLVRFKISASRPDIARRKTFVLVNVSDARVLLAEKPPPRVGKAKHDELAAMQVCRAGDWTSCGACGSRIQGKIHEYLAVEPVGR
jgi:hypothetical protein